MTDNLRPLYQSFSERLTKVPKNYDRFAERYIEPDQRRTSGKALREKVPRETHAGWRPPPRRKDPIDILSETNRDRMPNLVPIRHARMLTSAFAFFRGSAAIMAYDLSRTPSTRIRVQACGDCHLLNFGAFATPERRLLFDINDFDETLPAPWEWDVKRLAASFAVAARYTGLKRSEAEAIAETAVRSYRKWMAQYARMNTLDVWYDHVDVEELIKSLPNEAKQARLRKKIAKARAQSILEHDFPKLAAKQGKQPRIKDNPPLIFHLDETDTKEFHAAVTEGYFAYLRSLAPHHRALIDRFKLCDLAMKVVGVGSVGTLCAIVLGMVSDTDPLFLQIKEANASVVEPYAGASEYKNHGERVVVGQRFMQAASDMLLGWSHGNVRGRDFYVRQLRDMKMSVTIETMDKIGFDFYAKLCGRVLARGHARSGDAVMIAGYLGNRTVFDEAAAQFATEYADQTERDHDALIKSVRTGRLAAISE